MNESESEMVSTEQEQSYWQDTGMTWAAEKLCVALGNCSIDQCREALTNCALCELRLDLLDVNEQLKELLSLSAKTVVTYRPKNNETADDTAHRLAVLKSAANLGATYIDIELEAEEIYRSEIIAAARVSGTQIITSYHNFTKTPSLEELQLILADCFATQADVAKIACTVNKPADNAALLGLLSDGRPLVVVGMGELGKLTRTVAPLLGSLFTFVTSANNVGTAPGQMSFEHMMEIYAGLVTNGLTGEKD